MIDVTHVITYLLAVCQGGGRAGGCGLLQPAAARGPHQLHHAPRGGGRARAGARAALAADPQVRGAAREAAAGLRPGLPQLRDQAAQPPQLQVAGHRRADDPAGLPAVHEDRRGGAADLGAGAVRGEVSQPHQVHGALQQHVILDQDSHTAATRRQGDYLYC